MARSWHLAVVALTAAILPAAHCPAQNSNQSTNLMSGILAGDKHTIAAKASYAVVAGGYANSIRSNASFSLIGSGSGNTIHEGAQYSVVVGGTGNSIQTGAICSLVGGGWRNTVFSNAESSVVAGGFRNTVFADADHATVSGGTGNAVGPRAVGASLGGGVSNVVQTGAQHSVIGGGVANNIRSYAASSFLGGGFGNVVHSNASYAVVAGGSGNAAAGSFATVPGGTRAKAIHAGAFVWSGVNSVDTVSTNTNSFTVRAPGGVRFLTTAASNAPFVGVILANGATQWASLSDRGSKTGFEPVRPREILDKVAALPVTFWQYKHDPGRRYIGPMAQDFHAAFGLGADDKTIGTLDSDGVMYAAIQGLIEELGYRDKAIEELRIKCADVDELRSELRALREQVQAGLPPEP